MLNQSSLSSSSSSSSSSSPSSSFANMGKKTEEACIGCSIPFFNNRNKMPTSPPNDDFRQTISISTDEQDQLKNDSHLTILVQELKVALAEHGVTATIYWPSKSSHIYEPKQTIIKKKRNEERVECELVVDNQPKKFRFMLYDIISVNKGKGESKGIPTDIDSKLCMHFIIKDKGELNLSIASEILRNDMVEGFRILAKNSIDSEKDKKDNI
jgi:hypothetical protein